ncbi:MAG TPA: cytochrome c oxidase subunit II transmembrane domain-containing protein [Humisphaera sp.]
MSTTNTPPTPSPAGRIASIAVASLVGLAAAAAAAYPFFVDKFDPTRRLWLPRNLSTHGDQIDLLFNVIFSITAVVMIGVFYYLLKFCIQYRHRGPNTKGHFSHGNKRLELIWTAIPAVILLALALWTKGSWDNYRYSPTKDDPNKAQILVVGQQFRWNVVYPGPDKKLGRYLIYPKVTDLTWPYLPPGATVSFPTDKYPGPAFMPAAEAKKYLDDYVSGVNPLGKDFSDPDGADDDWKDALSRTLYVPKGRPVEIHLSSKDVLHDFFLPDYRVKLDAVPGMRGLVYFTATRSSEEIERESLREYALDDLLKQISVPKAAPEYRIVVAAGQEAKHSGKVKVKTTKRVRKGSKVVTEEVETEEEQQVAKDRQLITASLVADLKGIGLKTVTAYKVAKWDLVCEELCGAGHTNMPGEVVVLEPAEYVRRFETPAGGTPPTTAPSNVASARP